MEHSASSELASIDRATRPSAWDGFVVGPENALAHRAVLAMAQGADGFSPLLIHGPSGVGKSRLLAGLIEAFVRAHPGASVAHLTADAFAEACHEADAMPGGWAELRDRFRRLDLLAIDDLPRLSRSALAMTELEPTLDAMARGGRWMAMTAAQPTAGWDGWPARLVDRLRVGLAVRVDRPGFESRRQFLRDRAVGRGLSLDEETLAAMACEDETFGPLDGRLTQLVMAHRVEHRPMDRATVDAMREAEGTATDGPVSVDAVLRAVAAHFHVRVRDLRSGDRHRGLVRPRHLAIYMAGELCGLGPSALGRAFGGRDPKTIRHAQTVARQRLFDDPALHAAAESIRKAVVGRVAEPSSSRGGDAGGI